MTPEGRIATSIMKWLRDIPKNYCRKVNDMNNVGMPDIDGCFTGLAYYFEVKRPGGKITAKQIYEIERIRSAGGRARVVYSLNDVKSAFFEWFRYGIKQEVRS